jgi:hypothetical protein
MNGKKAKENPMIRFYFLLLLSFFWMNAMAENIDFATLPAREMVQLTIYNAEDLTLVQERRRLVFREGQNLLQFSWANTLIDPTSVEVRFLQNDDTLEVLSTRFPHDRKEMLYWVIDSTVQQEAMVEISYFTSGLRWDADYRVLLAKDRKALNIENFIRVTNNSGEDYEQAQVRVVVGKINLTETIAELARRGIVDKATAVQTQKAEMRRLMAAPPAPIMMMESYDAAVGAAFPSAPKEVAKEAFGEYFLYSIAGTETIPHGWQKRLLAFSATGVKAELLYRFRPWQYGEDLRPVLKIKNTSENQLGKTPLPNGVLRVYQALPDATPRYLGQQTIAYVPIDDTAEILLASDPQVFIQSTFLAFQRSRLQLRLLGINAFRFLGEKEIRTDWNGQVVGWDELSTYADKLINNSDFAVDLEIRRQFSGDVEVKGEPKFTLHDFETVEYLYSLPAKSQKTLTYTVLERKEKNAQQQKITLP